MKISLLWTVFVPGVWAFMCYFFNPTRELSALSTFFVGILVVIPFNFNLMLYVEPSTRFLQFIHFCMSVHSSYLLTTHPFLKNVKFNIEFEKILMTAAHWVYGTIFFVALVALVINIKNHRPPKGPKKIDGIPQKE